MQSGNHSRGIWQRLGVGTTVFATMMNLLAPTTAAAKPLKARDAVTTTPIQHVIVIVGENRTFDHLFATYVPPAGQTVDNLLSKGIINADGTPGPNFALGAQSKAVVSQQFSLSPQFKTPWSKLPPTNVQFSPPGY